MLSVRSHLLSLRLVATIAMFAATACAYGAAPPSPSVIGPVPVNATPGEGGARDYPQFASEPYFDLARAGYTEEEFFTQGTATQYNTPALANGVVVSTGHPYKTRIIVHRPTDPKRFNGVVLVEWVNVTSGYGADLHWQHSREYLTREGYVHIGVQAQRVGIHQAKSGLKEWSPLRYDSLDVTDGGTITDDSLSYDIFSQVVSALKGPQKAQILPSLEPEAFFAVGQSQSAMRLTLYYNSIQPLHKVFDGFLLQVAGGPFRTDVAAPMFHVLSEVEQILPALAVARQPDSNTYRRWEIAGATHVDYWWIMYRQALALRDGLTPPTLICQPEVGSHVPMRYVLNAGYHHLTRWVLNGKQPPHAPYLVLESANPPSAIVRDADGIALGGIRLHEVDVPIAVNRGDQPGIAPAATCSNLYGQHVAFSDGILNLLYPTKDDYMKAVSTVVKRNVSDGFILREDAEEIVDRAYGSAIGTRRPAPIK